MIGLMRDSDSRVPSHFLMDQAMDMLKHLLLRLLLRLLLLRLLLLRLLLLFLLRLRLRLLLLLLQLWKARCKTDAVFATLILQLSSRQLGHANPTTKY